MLFGEIAGGRFVTTEADKLAIRHRIFSSRILGSAAPVKMSEDGTTMYGGNCLINCTNQAGLNLYSFHNGMAHVALCRRFRTCRRRAITMDTFFRLVAISDREVLGDF